MFRPRLLTFALGIALAASTAGLSQKKGGKAADPGKGKELFEQCAVCHEVASDEKKLGPSLKGLFKKAKMTNGKKPTDQTVIARINEGGNGMPAYKDMLSNEEKAAVLAYLKTI
jgi:mono/diheme cytochrome c family protein